MTKKTTEVIFSTLKGLFGNNIHKIRDYIKPGQIYWEFSELENKWTRIKITYIRSGVFFYVYVNEPDRELYFLDRSYTMLQLVPETIDTVSICNLCNYDLDSFRSSIFDDYNGAIEIKVI